MKILKYFFEYILIKFLFFIFKILGYEKASNIGERIGRIFGPIFRSKNKITNNLIQTNVGSSEEERKKIRMHLVLHLNGSRSCKLRQ